MSETTFPLYWIPLLPFVGAALSLLLGRQLGRRAVSLLACTAVGLACVVALVATFSQLYPLWQQVHSSGSADVPRLINRLGTWLVAGELTVQLSLSLDPLSALMVLVVTFVGWLIHLYSTGYMAHEEDYARFFGYLNLFTGAMLLLVLADNLVLLFVGWEGVGLCSYLLIGFWYDQDGSARPGEANATAGRKAFLVNRVGDCAFLLGLFLLFSSTGTLEIDALATKGNALLAPVALPVVGNVSVAGVASLLLFIGATGKSAQLPLYVWLPDAMAGPTPVSALIHAATMVTAGVYMVARLHFIYLLSPAVLGVVALVGALTALYAATIALAQTDIKKVLAYSTISQLGYMFLAVGAGAFAAGIFHLFTHAFFKACLFLGAGAVIHAMGGRQDLREMGGLKPALPLTHWSFLLATLALSGIPFWSGFFSKDEILWQAFSAGNPAWPTWFPLLLYVLALLAALCTACYGFRLYYLAFTGRCRAPASVQQHLHEAPVAMTVPLLVLAVGATLLGVLGLPGLLGKELNVVHGWLAPVFEQGVRLAASLSAETVHSRVVAHPALREAGLLLLSVAVALLGWLALARWFYHDGFSPRVTQLARRFPRLHHTLQQKYWVDEIYRAIVLQPLRAIAWACSDALDRFLIDFVAINGSAKLVDTVGRMARALQNGDVQRYLVLLVVGVASLVYVFAEDRVEITVQNARVGQAAVFEAEPSLAAGASHEYRWDFDGDGSWDTAWLPTPMVKHVYRQQRRYRVRLEAHNKRWHRVATGSAMVEVR